MVGDDGVAALLVGGREGRSPRTLKLKENENGPRNCLRGAMTDSREGDTGFGARGLLLRCASEGPVGIASQ